MTREEVMEADKFHGKHCPMQPTIPPIPKGAVIDTIKRSVTTDTSMDFSKLLTVDTSVSLTEKMEQKIIFDGDKCYVETPIYPNMVKRDLVMTKEIFIKCYKRWIKGEEDGNDD